jgi:hypothetical protein
VTTTRNLTLLVLPFAIGLASCGPTKPTATKVTAAPTTTAVPTTAATTTITATPTLPPAPAGVPVQNRVMTPGAIFPVTAAQVCVSGYATSVRSVSSAEKQAVYAEYHTIDIPGAYEVDHLISLELGGSNEITNLWPEPYAPSAIGAHAKDKVENSLHADVCDGRMTLQAAQAKIAADWWTVASFTSGTVVTTTPAAPVATAATTTPVPTAIICNDGYNWPGTTRQGACHGHGGIHN